MTGIDKASCNFYFLKHATMTKTNLIAAAAPTLILLGIVAYLVYNAIKQKHGSF